METLLKSSLSQSRLSSSGMDNKTVSSYSRPEAWLWDTHIYGFAISWFLMGLYGLITGINLNVYATTKPYLNRICSLVCLLSVLRSVYLMVEPYETKRRLPPPISRSLYISGHPGFLLLVINTFQSFVKLSRLKLSRDWLERRHLLSLVALGVYLTLIGAEIASCLLPNYCQFINGPVQLLYVILNVTCLLIYLRYSVKMLNLISLQLSQSSKLLVSICGPLIIQSKTIFVCSHGTLAFFLKDKNGKAGDQVPKIRITDENECTVSYKSEVSTTSELDNFGKGRNGGEEGEWRPAPLEPLDLEFELNPTIPQKKASVELKPMGRNKKKLAVPVTRGEKLRQAIRTTYVPIAMGFFMASCQLYDCLTRSILKINDGKCSAGDHTKDWMNLVILTLYRSVSFSSFITSECGSFPTPIHLNQTRRKTLELIRNPFLTT